MGEQFQNDQEQANLCSVLEFPPLVSHCIKRIIWRRRQLIWRFDESITRHSLYSGETDK